MSKALDLVRLLINGANEYEKETGNKNPTVYLSRNNLLVIEKALNRLEAIENANPSEALEELIDMIEYFTRLDYVEPIVRNEIHDKFKDIYWHKLPHLDSIKEALTNAEKEHNSVNLLMQELDCKDFADLRKYARCGYQTFRNAKGANYDNIIIDEAQEPKHYLKWEDLEFDEDGQETLVLLNDTKYRMYYYKGYDECINLFTEDEISVIHIFDGCSPQDKQFFNDLHLERVEE